MKHIFIILSILAPVVAIDQLSKSIVRARLTPFSQSSYWGDTVRLQLMENPGAFLSLGASLDPTTRFSLLVVATFVFLFLITLYLIRQKHLGQWSLVATTLVLSGGIGNLVDRAVRGTVTDFMNLGIGNLRTGIFNIADVAITTGVVMLFISSSVKSKRESK